VLEPVGGGDEDGRQRGGVEVGGEVAIALGLADEPGYQVDPAAQLDPDRAGLAGYAGEVAGQALRAEGARVLAVQPDEGGAERQELVDRPRLGQCLLADELQPLPLLLPEHGERELFLGGEVKVERALGQAAAGDQLGERGVGVAAFGEDRGGGLQDGRARGVALGRDRFGRYRRWGEVFARELARRGADLVLAARSRG